MNVKRITLPTASGEMLSADYEPHEIEFMTLLRGQLDGADAEWAKQSMLVFHELKALFPGSRLEENHIEFESRTGGNSPSPGAVADETRRAIKQVDENADAIWKEQALAAVRATCEELPEFISDDVWNRGLDSTREDRALGPVLMRAKKEGWCIKTDRMRPSVRSHLSGKPVWESLLYDEIGAFDGGFA